MFAQEGIMKRTIAMFVVLSFLFVLCACSGNIATNIHSETYEPVIDMFTTAPQTLPQETSLPVTLPEEIPKESPAETSTPYNPMHLSGSRSVGFHNYRDGYRYNGGEMHVEIKLDSSGTVVQYGVAVMLFLDGTPQPFKTTQSPEVSYLHTIYDRGTQIIETIFNPVKGEAGDILDLFVITFNAPEYFPGENYMGIVQTSHVLSAFTRLTFVASAENTILPDIPERIISQSVNYVDLVHGDSAGFNMKYDMIHKFTVNEVNQYTGGYVYNVSPDVPVNLHYEMLGCIGPEVVITFFCQPCSDYNSFREYD